MGLGVDIYPAASMKISLNCVRSLSSEVKTWRRRSLVQYEILSPDTCTDLLVATTAGS